MTKSDDNSPNTCNVRRTLLLGTSVICYPQGTPNNATSPAPTLKSTPPNNLAIAKESAVASHGGKRGGFCCGGLALRLAKGGLLH